MSNDKRYLGLDRIEAYAQAHFNKVWIGQERQSLEN